MFFLSDIGNGGVLQRPSKDYKETNEKIRQGILVLNDYVNDDNVHVNHDNDYVNNDNDYVNGSNDDVNGGNDYNNYNDYNDYNDYNY